MEETENSPPTKKRSRGLVTLALLVFVVIAAWILVRPGVFTVQPNDALADGVTFIYHSRGLGMPFFSSPDGLCLQTQGSVTPLCRAAALFAAEEELIDRAIIKLPYIHWAYLQSTGGKEFER
ncbi:MAG: hypothetical protein JW918_00555 [Anaerolineae bacterium]|nr:hypothetical protein [Anaerolineae bacterium]